MQNVTTYGKFTDEVLANKMTSFLSNIELFPTIIGELDKEKAYVYTGLDWCTGEKEENAGRLLKTIDRVHIVCGNVFSDQAKRAIFRHGNDETKQLMEKIENYKLLPFPVRIDSKIVVDPRKSPCELVKIKAEYQEKTQRVPLKFLYNNGRFVLQSTLTQYMRKWRILGVGSMDACDELEFCDGNYIKTLVFHAKNKVLIIDCDRVYQGDESEPDNLTDIGPVDMLDKMVSNKHIASEFIGYFTVPTIGNILNHTRWIVPYLCGDEKHIYFDQNGKVIKEKKETAPNEHTGEANNETGEDSNNENTDEGTNNKETD